MQTITLKDWSILENFATIYVNDPNINNSYAIQTELDHLVANSTDKIGFTIKQTSAIPTATLVLNNYWDWYSDKTYKELNIRPKAFSHNYVPGIYNPQNTIYIDDCISLNTQSTIVIQNEDICLKAYLDGTLNQFKWDLDKDWIPDICDDDIDWDWLPNLIWIVQKDNTDLSIDENNTNIQLVKLHKGICQLDNCPTISNEKQLDLNNNWRWDSCDEINLYKNISSFKNSIFYTNYNNIFNSNNWESDSDNDWIVDSLDACPELPENYNWVNDFDWCPEIWAINNCAINSYNYVNRNFSVYPTVQKNRRLLINDPISPEPSCKNDECKTICLWNVDNCDDCNWNKNCNKIFVCFRMLHKSFEENYNHHISVLHQISVSYSNPIGYLQNSFCKSHIQLPHVLWANYCGDSYMQCINAYTSASLFVHKYLYACYIQSHITHILNQYIWDRLD